MLEEKGGVSECCGNRAKDVEIGRGVLKAAGSEWFKMVWTHTRWDDGRLAERIWRGRGGPKKRWTEGVKDLLGNGR